jgi:hypothetical protein
MKRMIRLVMCAYARHVLILKSAESILFVARNFSIVGVLCSAPFHLLQILPSVSPNGL